VVNNTKLVLAKTWKEWRERKPLGRVELGKPNTKTDPAMGAAAVRKGFSK
jgi:hypothetical protein